MVSGEETTKVVDTVNAEQQADQLAELIMDLNARVERLESANNAHKYWLTALADECGYELAVEEVGELGKVLGWKKKSGLVTL